MEHGIAPENEDYSREAGKESKDPELNPDDSGQSGETSAGSPPDKPQAEIAAVKENSKAKGKTSP